MAQELFPFGSEEKSPAPQQNPKQDNLGYLTKSMEAVKLGTDFHEDLRAEIKTGKPTIELTRTFKFKDTGEELEYKPKFVKSETDNWYFFKGYTATLESDPAKSIFVNVFEMKGFSTQQARDLLNGAQIGNIAIDKKDQEYERYTRMNVSGQRDEWGNLRLEHLRTTNTDYSIIRALNQIPFSSPPRKEDLSEMAEKLFAGIKITRQVRTSNDASEPLTLENRPFDNAIRVSNSKGQHYDYQDKLSVQMTSVKKEKIPAVTESLLVGPETTPRGQGRRRSNG